MSLLSVIRSVCDRIGLQRPSTIIGASDQTTRTLLAFANEEGRDLANLHTWQKLRKEVTFVTVAAEVQTSSIPTDWLKFVPETFWNRTNKRPLYGPKTPQEWQQMKAWTASPVVDSFMVRAGTICIYPSPTAGETCAYEYAAKNWVESGGSYYEEYQLDADTTLVPERLIGLGVIWRFKQSKGLAWEGDYGKWETAFAQERINDEPTTTLQAAAPRERRPGVGVPEGSWAL